MPCRQIRNQITCVVGMQGALHVTSHNISIELNGLSAHQFVLPWLFIHHVWVSANAISCGLMITESYWCKERLGCHL